MGGRRGSKTVFNTMCKKMVWGGLPKLRSCQKWRTGCRKLWKARKRAFTRSKRPARLAQALNLSVAPADKEEPKVVTTLLGSNLSQFFTALSLFSTFLMLTKKSFLLEKVSHIKATTTFSIDGFTLREVKNGKFHEQKVCGGCCRFPPLQVRILQGQKENKNAVLVLSRSKQCKRSSQPMWSAMLRFLGWF